MQEKEILEDTGLLTHYGFKKIAVFNSFSATRQTYSNTELVPIISERTQALACNSLYYTDSILTMLTM